jgi:hypothetical protein
MVRFEPVSSAFELPAKLGVIINFAVKSDYQLIVQGSHRLCAGGDIKDREAPVAQKDSGTLIDPGAFAVRSAMRERIGHPMQIRAFSAPDKSGNPAHGFSVGRSAFGVQRSAFSVQRSAFSVQRSAFSVQRQVPRTLPVSNTQNQGHKSIGLGFRLFGDFAG